MRYLQRERALETDPLLQMIASVSVGVVDGEPVLDLDYLEDSAADTDMNVIMADSGEFIEVQGTAEGRAFSRVDLDKMLDLAAAGISEIFALQRDALAGD